MTEPARYPSLAGRAVFITGGATGIGAALVQAFAAQDARVGFVDVNEDAGATLADELAAGGRPQPWFSRCDVTDPPALLDAIAAAAGALGPIRVLVNNAANDDRHALSDITPEYWRERLAVNLDHHLFASQAVAPGMAAAGGGAIVNMGSITWVIGQGDLPAYGTAKAGIVGLTRALARRLGEDNIRVNCVMPGAILTDRQKRLWLNPDYEAEILARQCLKRHLAPDDVARLVLFLASDDAAAITSQSYIVDGGWV